MIKETPLEVLCSCAYDTALIEREDCWFDFNWENFSCLDCRETYLVPVPFSEVL